MGNSNQFRIKEISFRALFFFPFIFHVVRLSFDAFGIWYGTVDACVVMRIAGS